MHLLSRSTTPSTKLLRRMSANARQSSGRYSVQAKSLAVSTDTVVQTPRTEGSTSLRIDTETVRGVAIPKQLSIQFIDGNTGQEFPSAPISLTWSTSGGYEPAAALPALPSSFTPSALTAEVVGEGLVKVGAVTLKNGPGDSGKTFPLFSWLTKEQGKRIAFEGSATLAESVPGPLRQLRVAELRKIQGVNPPAPDAPRQGAERIYDYDVYNDLGSETGANVRPVLGGPAMPYPRRLKTNRKKVGDIEPNASGPWLPFDEQFSYSKQVDFTGTALQTAVPAILEVIEQIQRPDNLIEGFLSPVVRFVGGLFGAAVRKDIQFESFSDIASLYKAQEITLPAALKEDVPDNIKNIVDKALKQLDKLGKSRAIEGQEAINPELSDILKKLGDSITYLRSHVTPKVLAGRGDIWWQDAEFGRQMLAGQNPCVLQRLDQWPKPGLTITDADFAGLLPEGKSIPELMAEGRVFFVDYWEPFHAHIDKVNKLGKRTMYAGYALLVLTREIPASELLGSTPPSAAMIALSERLVPVAIQLFDGKETRVYTPPKPNKAPGELDRTPLQLWLLARTAFLNLDSCFHQLVSHWQRTHCVLEPYLIATQRQLSTAHPVYKLILPHFRFTLNINSNARGQLINAGGVIERLFTPADYSMEMSSIWYKKFWTFENQALPVDLKARGLMEKDGSMLLNDYPYAEDGMAIWNAFQDYFTEYLAIYYKDDAAVVADSELQAWWKEIKEKGHPDIKQGWPSLNGLSDLVFILNTMAWTASAHHAAVNFGQYDLSGFILNRSSIFKKPIPTDPNSAEYKKLVSAKGVKFESTLLEYISDPTSTAIILVVLKLLSTHAEDEQYLSDEKQQYLVDPAAKQAHARFVATMRALEERIEQLNRSGIKPTREPDANGMPYTLLLPSSAPGVTMRGVPYSVSI